MSKNNNKIDLNNNNSTADLSCDALIKIFNEDKKNLKQNLQKFFELS